jgi:hypothetical protein
MVSAGSSADIEELTNKNDVRDIKQKGDDLIQNKIRESAPDCWSSAVRRKTIK